MSVSLSRVEEPGDAELISAVRGGDVDAYGELFARHVDAARRLARQLAGPADADDLVSDAFAKVLTVLQRGGGPDLAFRAYLLTAVRRLHVDRLRSGARLRPVDDLTPFDPGLPFHDTAVEGFENAAAARAFASLPERWQMVLWHTEVEQQKPADIAVLLGMSANSVSALAYRAREGLRQAFISQHAADPDDVDCSWTRDHLGAYIRGGLSRRDAARVDDHLAGCRACTAVYLELTEVNSGLAVLLAPLLLGAAGAGYLSSSSGAAAGVGSGFALARTWVAEHASLAAISGVALTAAACVAVYAASHLGGPSSTPQGSPPALDQPPGISSSHPGSTAGHGPGNRHGHGNGPHRSASPGGVNPVLAAGSQTTSLLGPTAPTPTNGPPPATLTNPTGGPSSTPPTTGSTGGPSSTPPTTNPTQTTITFTSTPPPHPALGSHYVVAASGGSGRITFSVDPSTTHAGSANAACSLAGSRVTFDHAGTCVIAADRTVNAVRAASASATHATQTIHVPKGTQAIHFHLPTSGSVGTSDDLTATSGSGGPVTFAVDPSTTNNACTVTGAHLSFHHVGSCVVAADQAGNSDYLPASSVLRGLAVTKGTQAVTFTSTPPAHPAFGDTYPATATSDAGIQVSYSADPTTDDIAGPACTVTNDGIVTFHHAGNCVIDAQAGNDDYQTSATTQTIVVPQAAQSIAFSSAPPPSPDLGSGYHVTATGGGSGNPVTFSIDSSTTGDACSIAGSTVTFHHAGTCVVDADQAGNADYQAAPTHSQTIVVARAAQSITFTSTAPSNAVVGGHSYTVTATGGGSGNPVTFSSGTPRRLHRHRRHGHPRPRRHLHCRRRPGR